MRIDKLLSQLKYGSRKEIHQAIRQQRVKINGQIINKSNLDVEPLKVNITFDEETVIYYPRVVLMYHKPSGVLSANKDIQHKTVFEAIKEPFHRFDLKIAGRLDLDAEGLMILTDDGNLIHNIISPNKKVYKTYEVTTKHPVLNSDAIIKPMKIKDNRGREYTPLKPLVVKREKNVVTIKIREGKFHQVKRMFEAIGHQVIHLKRTQIHNLTLDIPVNTYRMLTEDEIKKLVCKEDVE